MSTLSNQPSEPDPESEEAAKVALSGQKRPEEGVSSQDRLDEAMLESFPASDPPSWPAGIKHKEDELTEDSSR